MRTSGVTSAVRKIEGRSPLVTPPGTAPATPTEPTADGDAAAPGHAGCEGDAAGRAWTGCHLRSRRTRDRIRVGDVEGREGRATGCHGQVDGVVRERLGQQVGRVGGEARRR